MLRRFAADHVKPHLSDDAWQKLRRLGGAPSSPPESSRPESSPSSLTELAVKHKTDKWSTRHRYTGHYERHLGYLRNEQFTLLEIGIGGYARDGQGGASLRMWKEFFPNARIIGLDIEDKSFAREDRIETVVGSQDDQEVLRRIAASAPDLQVVIDDGSHVNDHILATFNILFPLLPAGGHYMIEDTQTSYWPRYGGTLDPDAGGTSNGLARRLVHDINYEEHTEDGYVPTYVQKNVTGLHVYHNLIFIDKGINAEGRVKMRRD
ncbi:CmcI family methyltransferase [Demetria terragena]|uniref:CmcI family methyltransferase n=1 Tax=Demetria terragena TaxID=63959 RepID=UPI0003746EEF|nr:CmcI family methyltransferase [Demetria terragena]